MLTEFDQNTIANMTAALEYVCKRIPADKDSQELRKFISAAMIACASSGHVPTSISRMPDCEHCRSACSRKKRDGLDGCSRPRASKKPVR
jgi:hypothetical protein